MQSRFQHINVIMLGSPGMTLIVKTLVAYTIRNWSGPGCKMLKTWVLIFHTCSANFAATHAWSLGGLSLC